jgi:hypothetical protein
MINKLIARQLEMLDNYGFYVNKYNFIEEKVIHKKRRSLSYNYLPTYENENTKINENNKIINDSQKKDFKKKNNNISIFNNFEILNQHDDEDLILTENNYENNQKIDLEQKIKKKKSNSKNNTIENIDELIKESNNILISEFENKLKKEINHKNKNNFNDYFKVINNNVQNISKFIEEELINKEIKNLIKSEEEKFKNIIIPKIKQKYYDDSRKLNRVISCYNKKIKNIIDKIIFEISFKIFKEIHKNISAINYNNNPYEIEINEKYMFEYDNIIYNFTIKFNYTIFKKF